MPFERTNRANFARTVLTVSMGGTDTAAQVETTDGFPSSPCRLVIEPESASRREIILFNGAFTATTFQTLSVDNRYLEGSAAASGITHPAGSTVISAPLSQDIDEVFDALEQTLTDVDTAVAGAVTDAEEARDDAQTAAAAAEDAAIVFAIALGG